MRLRKTYLFLEMLKLIIAFATITAVNAVTINTTGYSDANCTTELGTYSIIEIAPGKGCFKVPLGYATQNLCASRDGDNYISTQTHGCNSDCSVCTGATYTLTYSAENFAKANKGECYAFNHSDVAGTMRGIVFNPPTLNDICSSIPSPAGKSSGTTNRHRFGFLTFVVISLLYSL